MSLHICPGCGISKPWDVEHFYTRSSAKNGLDSTCKTCKIAVNTARQKARREAGLPALKDPAKQAAYEAKNRARENARRQADVEAARARSRAYAQTPNGRKVRAKYARKWRLDHPAAAALYRARRRYRLLASPEHFTDADVIHLHVTQLDICHYCKKTMTDSGPLQRTIDHLDPLSRYCDNSALNIVLACRKCNSSKGAQTAEEFEARTDRPGL